VSCNKPYLLNSSWTKEIPAKWTHRLRNFL
jgi:hypothetical protein